MNLKEKFFEKLTKIEPETQLKVDEDGGDRFDVDAVNRHNLDPKVIMGKNGCIDAPGYEGMYVTKARKKILEDLEEAGLIIEQKEMTHAVNVHDKCGFIAP